MWRKEPKYIFGHEAAPMTLTELDELHNEHYHADGSPPRLFDPRQSINVDPLENLPAGVPKLDVGIRRRFLLYFGGSDQNKYNFISRT
jgi:hypothetical protein